MGDNIIGEIEGDVGDVFHFFVEMGFPRGHQGAGALFDQEIHDGKIVGGQVPNHIHIVLKQPQVDPHGIKIAQVPQRSVVNQLFYFTDRPGIEEGMVHHDPEPIFFRQVDQLLGMGALVSKRFFHQDVLTGA